MRNNISALQASRERGVPLFIDMISKRPLSGPAPIKTTSINIEGFSTNKSEILTEICMQNECNVICVQETHGDQNSIRPKIKNMKLVIERPHNKYGSAIFVRQDLKIQLTDYTNHDDIEIL